MTAATRQPTADEYEHAYRNAARLALRAAALTAENERLRAVLAVAQCDGEPPCPDDCPRCDSGEWALMCDDCRFYAAQDAELVSRDPKETP